MQREESGWTKALNGVEIGHYFINSSITEVAAHRKILLGAALRRWPARGILSNPLQYLVSKLYVVLLLLAGQILLAEYMSNFVAKGSMQEHVSPFELRERRYIEITWEITYSRTPFRFRDSRVFEKSAVVAMQVLVRQAVIVVPTWAEKNAEVPSAEGLTAEALERVNDTPWNSLAGGSLCILKIVRNLFQCVIDGKRGFKSTVRGVRQRYGSLQKSFEESCDPVHQARQFARTGAGVMLRYEITTSPTDGTTSLNHLSNGGNVTSRRHCTTRERKGTEFETGGLSPPRSLWNGSPILFRRKRARQSSEEFDTDRAVSVRNISRKRAFNCVAHANEKLAKLLSLPVRKKDVLNGLPNGTQGMNLFDNRSLCDCTCFSFRYFGS